MYQNIEKSGFVKGAYVGYSPLSGVWLITRLGNGWIAANKSKRDPLGVVIRKRLRDISEELRVR